MTFSRKKICEKYFEENVDGWTDECMGMRILYRVLFLQRTFSRAFTLRLYINVRVCMYICIYTLILLSIVQIHIWIGNEANDEEA